MSLYDYHVSLRIGAGSETKGDPPFAALVMAAFRKADSVNLLTLREGFPAIWDEFRRRYEAPDGTLPEEVKHRTRHRAEYNTCGCSEHNPECPSAPYHCPDCSCDECGSKTERLGYR